MTCRAFERIPSLLPSRQAFLWPREKRARSRALAGRREDEVAYYEETRANSCTGLSCVAGRGATTAAGCRRPDKHIATHQYRCCLQRGNDRDVLQRNQQPEPWWLRINRSVRLERCGWPAENLGMAEWTTCYCRHRRSTRTNCATVWPGIAAGGAITLAARPSILTHGCRNRRQGSFAVLVHFRPLISFWRGSLRVTTFHRGTFHRGVTAFHWSVTNVTARRYGVSACVTALQRGVTTLQ